MAAITSRPTSGRPTLRRRPGQWTRNWAQLVPALVLAAVTGWLAHYGLDQPWFVVAAAAVVVTYELALRRHGWPESLVEAIPLVVTGTAAVVVVALSTKAASQVVFVLIYGVWRWRRAARQAVTSFTELLILMAVAFQAIFLATAYWQVPAWASLLAVWLCAYGLAYQGLAAREEPLARVLAATWALIAVEASWVFLNWLVTYVLYEQYLVIPQAALVLTGLAYCFGGIYASQRQQALTRSRLAEYLLIALLLVVIVATSTPWRGTL